MKYKVTVVSGNLYDVQVLPKTEISSTAVSGNLYDIEVLTRTEISSIEVNTTPRLSLGEIEDIDTSNLQNNGILIYNSSTQTYEFVEPSEILDRADGVNNGSLDYGNY